MFLENSSLRVIEADAQDVLAVYRSRDTLQVAHGGGDSQSCEAFVVVVQEDTSVQVYAALAFLKSKIFSIFNSDDQSNHADDHESLLKEATAFLENYGFSLQPVSLNYSKALKEVILSDLRVVRPLVTAKKTAPRKPLPGKAVKPVMVGAVVTSSGSGSVDAAAPTIESRGKGGDNNADSGTVSAPKKDKSPQTVVSPNHGEPSRAAVAETDRDRLLSERILLEKESARELELLRQEQETLKVELARLEKEKSTSLQALQEETVRLAADKQTAQEAAVQELAAARQQVSDLSHDLEMERQAAAERRTTLFAEVDTLRKERKALVEESGQELQKARQELASLNDELSALRSASEKEMAAVQHELDTVIGEKTDLEREHVQSLAALKAEFASLRDTQISSEELSALNNELIELGREKEEQYNRFSEERTRLLGSIDSLRNEQKSLHDAASEELTGLEKECGSLRELHGETVERIEHDRQELLAARERLLTEQNAVTEAAEQELAGLCAERDQLSEDLLATAEHHGNERDELLRELATLAEEAATIAAAHQRELAELTAERDRLSAERTAADSSFAEQKMLLQATVEEMEQESASLGQSRAGELAALHKDRERLQAAAVAVEEVATAERSSLEQEITTLSHALAEMQELHGQSVETFRKEISRLAAERDSYKDRTSRELGKLQEQTAFLNEEISAVRRESEEELRAAEGRVAMLDGELATLRSGYQIQLAALAERFSDLEYERDGLTEAAAREMSAAHGTAQLLVAELIQAEAAIARRAATARDAALSVIGTLLDEAPPCGTFATDEAVQTQIELLRRQAVELASANNSAKAAAMAELASLRETVARLAAEKSATERMHAAELQTMEREAELLLQRQSCPEPVADPVLGQGPPDEIPRAEDVSAIPVINAEITADSTSRDTVAPCAVALTEGASDSLTETGSGVVQDEPAAISLEEAHVLSDSEYDDTDPFAFMQSSEEEAPARATAHVVTGPAVRFSIDSSLPCIRYSAPDGVLELYQSLNRSRVAMEDNTTVTCDAYLCVTSLGGALSVFIGLYLVDTKRVFVYAPERQPTSEAECANIVRNGLDFIEIVGFMMDGINLGKNSADRKKILGRVPVLSQVDD